MNEHVPPFLQALELGPDADERAIRRAYAKRLKRIDAEADPAGFQDLRETLERALQWAAWRAREAAEEAASPPVQEHDHAAGPGQVDPGAADPPPHQAATPIATAAPLVRGTDEPASTPEPAPETAPTLPPGEPAYLDFHAHVQRGVESPEHATALLEAALADERLVNLEARTFFEWRVAGLLANGWQPGHEMLFWPAAVVFGWDKDRRHLELFGALGAFMDAAIRERLVFFGQDASEFERQRQLIQRLRVARSPDRNELRNAMPRLAVLLQRFPNWTRMMTPETNVQEWIAAWNAVPPEERERQQKAAAAESGRRASKGGRGFGMGWGVLIGIIALVRGLVSLADSGSPSPPPPAYETTAPAPPDTTPSASKLDLRFDGRQEIFPRDPVPAAASAPVVLLRAKDQAAVRRALEELRRTEAHPVLPGTPAPQPRLQPLAPPTQESLAPRSSKYELHAQPPEARIDPTAPSATPRRWGSGYTPPADLRLGSTGDGTPVPGLADLARPPKPAPAKPQDDDRP